MQIEIHSWPMTSRTLNNMALFVNNDDIDPSNAPFDIKKKMDDNIFFMNTNKIA